MRLVFIIALFSLQHFAFAQGQSPAKLPEYFKPDVKHPLGVRPDCSEAKVPVEKLEELAKGPAVNNIVDFLNNLPSGSFQTFTLVTNSKSLQKGSGDSQVSEEWPRVLRTSTDGKITFSYTCNPDSPTYNQVEVMYYDDNGREMKTMSIDLKQKPDHRVNHNSQECLKCHATSLPDGTKSIKPIWPEYFQWGGCDKTSNINLYGANDDHMDPLKYRTPNLENPDLAGCDKALLKEQHMKEIESFKKFKAKNLGTAENNNPCYSSLPWAKAEGAPGSQYDPAKYESYPYASTRDAVNSSNNSDGYMNYYLRPNLKFTETYSRLNAKRIAGLIEKSRNFDRIKYFLALEASGCLLATDVREINRLIPSLNYKYQLRGTTGAKSQDPTMISPLLYAYSQNIGLKDENWTLEFNGQSTKYNAAIPRTHVKGNAEVERDSGMPEVVGGEILSMISSSDPIVKSASKDAYTKGAAEWFGPQWSCLDDMGSAIRDEAQGTFDAQGVEKPLCKSIRASLKEYLKVAKPDCEIVNPTPVIDELAEDMEEVSKKLTENDPVAQGESVVANQCMGCHGDGLPSISSYDLTKIESNLASGKMPRGGSKLSDRDRNAVLEYVKSTKQKK